MFLACGFVQRQADRVVRRMNEVTLCWARLVLGWVTVFGQVYYLGMWPSHLGQLSVASLRGC